MLISYQHGKKYVVRSSRSGEVYTGTYDNNNEYFELSDGSILPLSMIDKNFLENMDHVDILLGEIRAWRAWWEDQCKNTVHSPIWSNTAPCRSVLEAVNATNSWGEVYGWSGQSAKK